MQAFDNHVSDKTPGNSSSYLAQAWLVVLLAIIFGTALAVVHVRLGAVIAANKLNETLTQVPQLILGPSPSVEVESCQPPVEVTPGIFTTENDDRRSAYPLFRVDQKEKLAGWVVKANGQGYADNIDLLIGLDAAQEVITGIFVLEQKETPGLGNKITHPQWRHQFVGKKTALPLRLQAAGKKAPDAVDAITGATISSRSVVEIINRTLEDTRGQLVAEAIKYSPEIK